jgi:transcriptional regulator with XRE-family HTH domain
MDGKELKAWREKRKLSQKKLAELLGVNLMTVWRYEKGEIAFPHMGELALIAIDESLKAESKRSKKKTASQ